MSALAGSKVLLSWQEDFNVGIEGVDAQHQRLLVLINGLWDATVRGTSGPQLLTHVDELARYTRYHFADEEQAMQGADYPQLAAHRRAHQGFVARIAAEREKVMADGYVTLDLVRFLQEWLVNHIAVEDKHYAAYVLGNAQRMSFFSRLLRRFA